MRTRGAQRSRPRGGVRSRKGATRSPSTRRTARSRSSSSWLTPGGVRRFRPTVVLRLCQTGKRQEPTVRAGFRRGQPGKPGCPLPNHNPRPSQDVGSFARVLCKIREGLEDIRLGLGGLALALQRVRQLLDPGILPVIKHEACPLLDDLDDVIGVIGVIVKERKGHRSRCANPLAGFRIHIG